MFSKSFLSAAAACSLLVSSVNAHMVMTSPVPYGNTSLNNSPLAADGSDFPCKQRPGVYDMSQMNTIPVGVPQQLAFMGGATHGGGSCQLSVTMDQEPDKNSKWKVIHSIIGGCPNSAAGNAGGSASSRDNPTFEYSMPKGMPNGKYTMAWTWFNKLGNREMYMNCAPIEVSGGADDKKVYDTLPDMFVANIGNGCETQANEDFVFPECGQNVQTVAKTALGSSTSGVCAAATGGTGSGSGGGSGDAQTTPASPEAAPTGYGGGSGASSAAPAAPTYGGGYDDGSYKPSSAAAPAAPSYGGGGSGYGASYPAPAAPSVPPYDNSAGAAPPNANAGADAPAPTGYGPGAGAVGNNLKTKTHMVYETTFATVTATGPPPPGYTQPSEASPESPGSEKPPTYGTNRGAASNSSDSATDSNGSSSGTCSGGAVPCQGQDSVVCMDGGKWGLCDNGCAVPRVLTSGTTCSNGVISKRSMSNHVRKHLRPHAHKF